LKFISDDLVHVRERGGLLSVSVRSHFLVLSVSVAPFPHPKRSKRFTFTSPSNIISRRDHMVHSDVDTRCIADAGRCDSAVMSLTTMSPSAWRYYVEEIARGAARTTSQKSRAFSGGQFSAAAAADGALGIAGHEAQRDGRSKRLFGARQPASPRRYPRSGAGSTPTTSRAGRWLRSHVLRRGEEASRCCGHSPTSRRLPQVLRRARGSGRRIDRIRRRPRRVHPTRAQRCPPGRTLKDSSRRAFVHRTSRAADPQLHTHVLVANNGPRGGVEHGSLSDGRELFADPEGRRGCS